VDTRSATRLERAANGFFAASLVIGAWTYVGYPAVMLLADRLRRDQGPDRPPSDPHITVVIPAYNEAAIIADKISDTMAQGYPNEKLEIIVVADGSTDDTAAIAQKHGVVVLFDPARAGKSAAVNRGIRAAGGEIVCLTDANCSLAPGALRAVVQPFADERVSIVSGAKTTIGSGALGAGEGAYWRFESRVKRAESRFGMTMGAQGELCAVRKSTWRPIPSDVINDDLFLTFDALERGYAACFAPDAVSVEPTSSRVGDEFERRTRIGAGMWQSLIRHRSLAAPRRGKVAVAFWSHRILRNMVVPLLLPLTFVLTLGLARKSKWARRLLVLQTASYTAAVAGLLADARALGLFTEIALVNAATVRGAWRYVTGRQNVAWERADRDVWMASDLHSPTAPRNVGSAEHDASNAGRTRNRQS
jgi:poly-beta-1,6-N-acetyl-D-glucosamine synthase